MIHAIDSKLQAAKYVGAGLATIGLAGARSEEHRLNSSHTVISYAVFCLKKKKKKYIKKN